MNSRPEVLFDNIADRIALEISKARDSIYVAVAWFSNEKLFNTLVEKAKQGVMVRLMISNDEQTQKNAQKLDYKILNSIGDSDVSLVKPELGGLMHNKLCIIDRLTVITGSYNWTYYADNKNHENVFIFQDREVAETCIRHFKEIISHYLNATVPHSKSSHNNQNKAQNSQKSQNTNKIQVSKNEKQQTSQNKYQSSKNSNSSDTDKANQQVANDCISLGQQYQKDGAYELAFECYKKAALMGDSYAQILVGFYYQHGWGIQKDKQKAVEWYTLSAEQGYADAQYRLGLCYQRGDGIRQDFQKAVEWYQKAVKQNNSDAQYWLGYCYEYGRSVKENKNEAIEWYKKSARQGNERAIDKLSIFRVSF